MTFAADEKSIHGGRRRTLYEFVLLGGDQAAYYYTSHDEQISELSNVYTPAVIRHGPVAARGKTRPSEMLVKCAHNLGVVTELAIQQPPRSCLLTIRRYHGNIANVSQLWQGQVRSAKVKGLFAELRVPSTMQETLESVVPSVNNQGMCNHVLYGTHCGVTRATFTKTTTVATITSDPRVITVVSLAGAADQTYKGGEIIRNSDGERRLIVDQTGVTLTLVRAFRNLSVSDSVDCAQGCAHTIEVCNSKFSNKANYGGVPYIPAENLFRFGVQGV